MAELDGKVAVITGAASGMGAETARLFAAEGARVLLADLDEERARSVADDLGDAADVIRTDVSREADVAAMIDRAVQRWGGVDVLFNNAGFGGARGPIETISDEDYTLTMDVLLKGPFLGIKHAAPVMKAAGTGSIINTASVAGLLCGEAPHLYSVAKAAVIHLTRSVALELGEHGVRVNAICPGVIATPLAAGRPSVDDDQLERFRQRYGRYQPIGRIGEPQDIAHAALYLASDRSGFVTGTAHVVDGGASAGRAWARQSPVMTEAAPIRMYRPPDR